MTNPLSPYTKKERQVIDAWAEHCGDEQLATAGFCERYMMDIEDTIMQAAQADDPGPQIAAAGQQLFRLKRQLNTMPDYEPEYKDEAAERVVGWLKDKLRKHGD